MIELLMLRTLACFRMDVYLTVPSTAFAAAEVRLLIGLKTIGLKSNSGKLLRMFRLAPMVRTASQQHSSMGERRSCAESTGPGSLNVKSSFTDSRSLAGDK